MILSLSDSRLEPVSMGSAVLSTPRPTEYTTNLHFTPFQNPNPNPHFNHFFLQTHQRLPATSGLRYITFRLSSYTRTELRGLKTRLISDLERVRFLRQRLLESAVGRKRQCGRMTQAQKRKMKMRECGQMLGKLMQHKHGWVFNAPVDAVALKLFDYHSVISKPMDLGTIRSKLAKNGYNSPVSFASDVRLTFQNAMVYNGKGSNVYLMAERLLLLFENMWDSSNRKGVNQVKKRNWVRKPVARVLEKRREMTEAEKTELAERLMSLKLGREGMNQIMEIVKRGVLGLEFEESQGDEIELDIAALDNDTLWGLHGFIMRNGNEVVANLASSGGNEVVVEEEEEEEDVDIGDEMGLTVFTPIEIEKDGEDDDDDGESSSESGSSSSSSGDSGRNG